MLQRRPADQIFSDTYKNKMRLIAGPRQCGKTTLAKQVLEQHNFLTLYYNWDLRQVKDRFYKNSNFYYDDIYQLNSKQDYYWVCFDEIHKQPSWKNILKDCYDANSNEIHFIVTGSARLDLFRQAGDSLTGRYYLFHLFPLLLCELTVAFDLAKPSSAEDWLDHRLHNAAYPQSELESLLQYSGFPEPFTEQNENLQNMWRDNYLDTIIREDIRDLTQVRDVERVARLALLLPDRIGSPLSVNSMVAEVEFSYTAVANYLNVLNFCYMIFQVSPYHQRLARTLKKEQKVYFFDWTRNKNEANRYENYVALELLQRVTFWKDHGFGNFALRYIRTIDGKETDFLITKDENPWLLLEAKLSDESVDSHHLSNAAKLGNIPFVQLLHKNNITKKIGDNTYVMSASRFFAVF